jgi:high-affinity iron transporter
MKKNRSTWSERNTHLGTFLALLILFALVLNNLLPISAQSVDPWSAGGQIRDELFAAQKAILANKPDVATQHIQTAQQVYQTALEPAIKVAAPDIDTQILQTFGQLLSSALEGTRLSYTRSYLWAMLLRGSREVVLAAVRRDDKNTARTWLLLREYRTSTRYMRPDADATLALQSFLDGKTGADTTVKSIDLDLLDGYQTLMIEAMADAEAARTNNFTTKVAEQAGLIVGYFEILQAEFTAERGQDAFAQVQKYAASLRSASIANDGPRFDTTLAQFRSSLRTFQAAPLPGPELALRIQQVDNQIGLASLEYARGVRDGKIITDFEYQEALASIQTAFAAFADIEPLLVARDLKATDELLANIKKLDSQMRNREEPEVVQATTDAAKKVLHALTPPDFVQRISGSSDQDIIATFLNQVETSVAAGDYAVAETARLHAYQLTHARFNLRLLGTLPDLANEIEGLFWQGTFDHPGLATLISSRASGDQINAAVTLLNDSIGKADQSLSRTPTLALWFIPTLIGAFLFVVMRFVAGLQKLRGLSLVLLAFSLCIIAGVVIHALQANDALPITPLYGFHLPVWAGEWFGLYPTLQGTLTQLGIIGLTYIATLLPQRSQTKAPSRSRTA